MSHFYDLEKPGTFGVLKQFLQDTGKDLFKTHKTGNRVIRTCNRVNTLWENSDSTVLHSRGYIVSSFWSKRCVCGLLDMPSYRNSPWGILPYKEFYNEIGAAFVGHQLHAVW